MIDLDALVHDDGDRLAERYLNAIKLLRKDPGGPEVRHSDLAALGSILQAADMPAPSE
jgi:hypothetical protein